VAQVLTDFGVLAVGLAVAWGAGRVILSGVLALTFGRSR
jgi:hypothetical protein